MWVDENFKNWKSMLSVKFDVGFFDNPTLEIDAFCKI